MLSLAVCIFHINAYDTFLGNLTFFIERPFHITACSYELGVVNLNTWACVSAALPTNHVNLEKLNNLFVPQCRE